MRLRLATRRCVGVSPHLRYLRFFLMGLEIWKHIVIQFRSNAIKKYLKKCSPAMLSHCFGKSQGSRHMPKLCEFQVLNPFRAGL